jgi:hypothetical protein
MTECHHLEPPNGVSVTIYHWICHADLPQTCKNKFSFVLAFRVHYILSLLHSVPVSNRTRFRSTSPLCTRVFQFVFKSDRSVRGASPKRTSVSLSSDPTNRFNSRGGNFLCRNLAPTGLQRRRPRFSRWICVCVCY